LRDYKLTMRRISSTN